MSRLLVWDHWHVRRETLICAFTAHPHDNQRRSCSNSDSDTDSDKNQETPRLTPATMVDRSCSRGLRRPPPPNHTVAPTSTSRPSQSPKNLEKEERERGNEKFVQGDFKGAVKSYTRWAEWAGLAGEVRSQAHQIPCTAVANRMLMYFSNIKHALQQSKARQ